MDEYGETPTYYIWPEDHEEGNPIPAEFFDKLRDVLSAAGIAFEAV